MILKNKYSIGVLVQFYEVEMFSEYIDSCVQMMANIENPENVTFHFGLGFQQYFETIVPNPKTDISRKSGQLNPGRYIKDRFEQEMSRLSDNNATVIFEYLTDLIPWYNIAKYRRELNNNFCDKSDFVLWGETDSLWPKNTLEIIEGLHEQVKYETPKYILTFAYRKNWDNSWAKLVHPLFENIPYENNDEWVLNNEASEKSYMSLERMNEINDIPIDQINITSFTEPKADGSCLVISSELIRSGVNIPPALIHCGEDESFMRMANLIMGDQFVQYHVENILRVHNRRHPRKRMYIKNEQNPQGFCDERKGDWWKRLEDSSKFNLENLRNQVQFKKIEEILP